VVFKPFLPLIILPCIYDFPINIDRIAGTLIGCWNFTELNVTFPDSKHSQTGVGRFTVGFLFLQLGV
jgi:hypothetical protein